MARMIDNVNDIGPVYSAPAPTATKPATIPAPSVSAPAPVPQQPAPAPTNTATAANPFVAKPATTTPTITTPVQTTAPVAAPTNTASMITGNSQPLPQMPPPPTTMVTGGNGQVQTGLPLGTGTPMPKPPGPVVQPPAPTPTYQPTMAPGQIVQDYLGQLLGSGSPYMENARLRGIETAQSRGLRNSSIAAGASQRAAIEAAQPFVQDMVGIQQNREQRAFQGDQSALERQFTASQNQLDRDQQITMSQVQNWLNDQQFRRELNGQLSLLPIQSAAQLNQLIQQYALENPQVYTPDIISGMTNFFNTNFLNTLKKYFPGTYGGS